MRIGDRFKHFVDWSGDAGGDSEFQFHQAIHERWIGHHVARASAGLLRLKRELEAVGEKEKEPLR